MAFQGAKMNENILSKYLVSLYHARLNMVHFRGARMLSQESKMTESLERGGWFRVSQHGDPRGSKVMRKREEVAGYGVANMVENS